MGFEGLLKTTPRSVPLETQQKSLIEYKRFNVLFARAGGELHPKNHLMLHCFQEVKHFGNPKWYHCYLDESFNGVIAKIARSCHRLSWATVVFHKVTTASKLQKERIALALARTS